jgi:hypothetical protein
VIGQQTSSLYSGIYFIPFSVIKSPKIIVLFLSSSNEYFIIPSLLFWISQSKNLSVKIAVVSRSIDLSQIFKIIKRNISLSSLSSNHSLSKVLLNFCVFKFLTTCCQSIVVKFILFSKKYLPFL